MPRISRSLTTPALLVVALMLSSCVGAAVQSMLMPQTHNAAYAGESAFASPADVLYAQGTALLTTTSGTNQPISGMILSLPAATTTEKHALVTFDATSTFPQNSCNFTIYTGTVATAAVGQNTSSVGAVMPMNIAIRLPLKSTKQTITVDWNSGGQTCQILDFYSLSAVISG